MYMFYYSPRNKLREYNVFHPTVRQSVSPSVLFFLFSATPLKPLNRISINFVVMKDIMCRYANPQDILVQFFFRIIPFLNLEICPGVNWPLWSIYQLNTYWKKDKIFSFVCVMKNLLLYFSKKNPSVYPLYVSFITNIQ